MEQRVPRAGDREFRLRLSARTNGALVAMSLALMGFAAADVTQAYKDDNIGRESAEAAATSSMAGEEARVYLPITVNGYDDGDLVSAKPITPTYPEPSPPTDVYDGCV